MREYLIFKYCRLWKLTCYHSLHMSSEKKKTYFLTDLDYGPTQLMLSDCVVIIGIIVTICV